MYAIVVIFCMHAWLIYMRNIIASMHACTCNNLAIKKQL